MQRATLTVFLRSADRLDSVHDGLSFVVAGGHVRLSQNALSTVGHLRTAGRTSCCVEEPHTLEYCTTLVTTPKSAHASNVLHERLGVLTYQPHAPTLESPDSTHRRNILRSLRSKLMYRTKCFTEMTHEGYPAIATKDIQRFVPGCG